MKSIQTKLILAVSSIIIVVIAAFPITTILRMNDVLSDEAMQTLKNHLIIVSAILLILAILITLILVKTITQPFMEMAEKAEQSAKSASVQAPVGEAPNKKLDLEGLRKSIAKENDHVADAAEDTPVRKPEAGVAKENASHAGQGLTIEAEGLKIELSEVVSLLGNFETSRAESKLRSLSNFHFRGESLKKPLEEILTSIKDHETEKAQHLLNDFISKI